MTTNITTEHCRAFAALRDPAVDNLALFSCFVDGTPSAAIVAIAEDGDGCKLTPLFVAVTPDMVLTDHDGVAPDG